MAATRYVLPALFCGLMVTSLNATPPAATATTAPSHALAQTTPHETDAAAYGRTISNNASSTHTPMQILKWQVQAIEAYGHTDFWRAFHNLENILATRPTDFVSWIFLSDVASKNSSNYDKALYAAIIASKLTKDPLEQALCSYLMGTIHKDFKAARQTAIDKYTKGTLENKLQSLLSDYPTTFDIYDITLPEQSDVGSACFSFSKPLHKGKDMRFEDYVSTLPKVEDLSVVAKGNQLCLSGLTFGAQYQVTFKKGLPGINKYALTQDQTRSILIEHRKPHLSFREKGYILPAKGPHILPLRTINVSKAKIEVLRVPLNDILQKINSGDFLGNIWSWGLYQIKENTGEVIASGTFDCQGEMDKTTISGFALDQVVGKTLGTGLYLVSAAKDGRNTYERATQWVVISDIGLSTSMGPDGLHVMARSLSTAQPLAHIDLKVLARSGRELGHVKTDKMGYAHIDEKLLSGEQSAQAALIYAMDADKDFTFINLRKDGFDFSDRGVKGRAPVKNADAFVYTERGIYRPGDTVTVMALLRDGGGRALKNTPLTLRFFRPDGIEVESHTTQDQGTGAHTFAFPTQTASFSGTWQVAAYLDPKGPEIGRTHFVIRDFVPPRVRVHLNTSQKVIHPLESLKAKIEGRYFYGPAAKGLKTEGVLDLVEENTPFEAWKGYAFGLEEENWTPSKMTLETPTTDENGVALVDTPITLQPDTTKILSARLTTSVFEAAGRAQSAQTNVLFWHQPFAIGLLPAFKDKTAPEGGNASFQVIAVNESGTLINPATLRYTLYEETHNFTWFFKNNTWQYETNIIDRVVSSAPLSLSDKTPTTLKVPVSSGYYRLEVLDEKTGVATSYRFHGGWLGASDEPDRPDLIQMSLDKAAYTPSDKIKLSLTPPFEGELSVALLDEKTFKPLHQSHVDAKGNTVSLSVPPHMVTKAGFYLMATVIRPMNVEKNRMPGRAVGLIWVDMPSSRPKLDMSVQVPENTRPESPFEVGVCVPHPTPDLRLAVAAVDEAILMLTDYATPDPLAHLFSQTLLAYTMRDSYGQLINPFGAKLGAFQVGGDGLSARGLANLKARTFKTVSLFSGIVDRFEKTKDPACPHKATLSFTLPDFSGAVRVMAVGWNDTQVGSADGTIKVSEPVETYLALPRFLAPKDETTVTLDVQNLTQKDGTFKVVVTHEGEVALKEPFEKNLTLKKDEMVHLPMNLVAKEVGLGTLKISLQGDGISLTKTWQISVRSSVFDYAVRRVQEIKPGESLTLKATDLAAFTPATAKVDVGLGTMPTFGAKSLAKSLREYPHGCLEQLASRLAAQVYGPDGTTTPESTASILEQMVQLQHFDGTFSLWSAQEESEGWLSVYALDLLTRAASSNLSPKSVMITRGMDWIKETINNQYAFDLDTKAYAHYLLAREGGGNLGTLRYFADNNQDALTSRQTLAFIGAAFALYADPEQANVWFNKAMAAPTTNRSEQSFYQSNLAQDAVLVCTLAETTKGHPKLHALAAALADASANTSTLTTFEKGWLVRAAHALKSLQKPLSLDVGGQSVDGPTTFTKTFSLTDLGQRITLTNKGKDAISTLLTLYGEAAHPETIPSKGFKIKRSLFTLKGAPITAQSLASGDLAIVCVEATLTDDSVHEVMILDMLPAGLEIEASQLGEQNQNTPWLEGLSTTSRIEKRDDRYMAVIRAQGASTMKVAYLVRAVTPGTYTCPGTVVESMYRPDIAARTQAQTLTITP